ncbi:Siderophore iron transporter mirC [Paramyrothecium foliicola]|nr:Siderophore iron transporter mirC [Paramyrothecium foliicola]
MLGIGLTAMFFTLTSVGGAIGSAISGAVWGRLKPRELRMYLPDGLQDQAMVIYGDINQDRRSYVQKARNLIRGEPKISHINSTLPDSHTRGD